MIWFVPVLIAAAVDWVAVARGDKRLEYASKPLTLLLLIAAALANAGVAGGDVSLRILLAALLFSLAGDVFLMLPRDLFVPGLGSFLIAHIAYVALFAPQAQLSARWFLAALVVVVTAGLVGRRIMSGLKRRGLTALAVPVVSYMVVISAMVSTVLATGDAVAAAGALLFFVSDALIGWTRFVHQLQGGPVAIHVTYHLGQIGLVIGALGLL